MSEQNQTSVGSATRTFTISLGEESPTGEIVYFFLAAEAIKIGFTRDLRSRFSSIDLACPVRLDIIGWVHAPQSVEAAAHKILQDFKLKGEWFRDCDEVRAVIDLISSGKSSEVVAQAAATRRKADVGVEWASEALRKLVEPCQRGESIRSIIDRAAKCIGVSYWRA